METISKPQLPATYIENVLNGRCLGFQADSYTSADRMNYAPMIRADEFGQVIMALGRFAMLGDLQMYAAHEAIRKISPYLNGYQIMANVAKAFAEIQSNGWTDQRTATGPEAGRPSSWERTVTERERILFLAEMTELSYYLQLGSVPGIGWALRELMAQREITVRQSVMPKVFEALNG